MIFLWWELELALSWKNMYKAAEKSNEPMPQRTRKYNVKFLKIKSSQLLLHKLFWSDVYCVKVLLGFFFTVFSSFYRCYGGSDIYRMK